MPVYCSAANCYSNSRLNEGMHFYRFPKDRERYIVQRPNPRLELLKNILVSVDKQNAI